MSTENTHSGNGPTISRRIKSWVPIILSGIVGLVLLFAGLQKAFEIDLFIRQIRDYEIITDPLLVIFSAWVLLTFECCLGAALIVNFHPKIAVPAGGLLFLIFISATGYAWATGVTDDCGCFGSWVERTPQEAMLEDIFLFAALMIAWKFNRSFRRWPFFIKELLTAMAFLAGLSLPVTAGPLLDRIDTAITGPVKEGFEPFVLKDFPYKDLSVGRHIIFILATDCSHCREEMDNLNMIAEDKTLPEVISVCINDQKQIEDFIFDFDPAFEIYQINSNDFWRLLGDGEIPRTILVNDGIIVKIWDFVVPDTDDLKTASGI
ncbi:MAG: hypothetical protein JW830_06365 [Bacteroidales bacterium]|nr:hypothetical protein [Bacteroidales bacterium]